jgi:Flp pilus assembly protein TadD
MVRAVALSAASALCLILAAGCAGTSEPASKAASAPTAAKIADATPDSTPYVGMPESNADVATLTKNLPSSLDGEIERAHLLRSKGDYDEAARSFAQLLLIAPDDARVVGGYGKVLEQQGHSQQALAFLKRAVQLDPRDWSLQSALGIAYDQTDDHKDARVAYERALALKPGDASVLNNYAVSRMLAGDYVNAKRMFAEAEAKGVSNPKIALNLDKLTSLDDVPVASAAAAPTSAMVERPLPATGIPVKTESVAVTNLAAPATPPAVQSPSARMSAKSVVTASAPPKTSASPSSTRIATAAPKAIASTVVMEKVPVDPLAGPTKHKPHTPQKLASTSHQPAKPAAPKTSVAAAPVAPPPALRTAADGD